MLYFLAPTSKTDREENSPTIPQKPQNFPTETGNSDVWLCLHEEIRDDNRALLPNKS